MLFIGIALCYLLGLAVMLNISRKYDWLELIGNSFLIGIGCESIIMFLLDIAGIKFNQGVLIGVNVGLIVLLVGLASKKLNEISITPDPRGWTSLKNINIPVIAVGAVLLYLLYAITVKNLFWPPTEHDTIGSFDKLGRIMAIEGKLKISLFDYKLEGAGGVYPPLFHSAFAYVYVFGAEISKIATTLFFVSLLSSFAFYVKRSVGAIAASAFTLILMLTPELFSHAALSLGNMPTAAYVCAGALATLAWIDTGDKKYFWLGAINTGFVVWIRSDTIVFTLASLLIVGIYFLKNKNWRDALVYGAFAVVPFIAWNLYLKLKINASTSSKFDLSIGYNAERMEMMTGYVKAMLFAGRYRNIDGGQLYGLSFILFFVAFLISAAASFKTGFKSFVADKSYLLIFTVSSFVLYFLVFYLIDVNVQNAPLWSLMESSFKRGIFCFVPLALFYAATNHASAWFFERLEKFRYS
jgi:hypothetical protein